MIIKYKYIQFNKIEDKEKTSVWGCYNNSGGAKLGEIKWYCNWRQYCFYPSENTIFNDNCLLDIVDFIDFIKQLKNSRNDSYSK